MFMTPDAKASELHCLSVIIPARDEEGCIASTVEHLTVELRLHGVPHEIVVVDDGSSDRTWEILQDLKNRIPALSPVQNHGEHGFGRAVLHGLDEMHGDAAVIMMADESDDCRDVVHYWVKLNEGWDCVFGSRFIKGGGTIDYPWTKLVLNRMAKRPRFASPSKRSVPALPWRREDTANRDGVFTPRKPGRFAYNPTAMRASSDPARPGLIFSFLGSTSWL